MGELLNFYIVINVVYEVGDKILQLYVYEEGNWKLYEIVCEVNYKKKKLNLE